MDTEIELKFLTSDSAESILPQLIEQFAQKHQGAFNNKGKVHLTNTYFDTADKLLRKADIGFRVRGADGRFEQTIKTAGKVVGGLHQRPEYNVAIATEQPQLALFEPQIFPENLNIEQLQQQLCGLFTTDFYRQKWQIAAVEQAFEIVFDQGFIDSHGVQSPICEVELELLGGNGDLMFEFAQTLAQACSPEHQTEQPCFFRLGFQSKAARGYQLYNDEQLSEFAEFLPVCLSQNDSLEDAFVKTVEHGLSFVQHHEQCFIENPSLSALRRFTDGAALIRHAMGLFSDVVSEPVVEHFRSELKWILSSFDWVEHARQLQVLTSQRSKYRKKLDKNESLALIVDEEALKDPELEDIKRFFSHPRYLKLLLELSRFLLTKDWRNNPEYEPKELAPGTLHEKAGELLSNAWQSLLNAMPKKQDLTIDDYMFHHKQLKRSLLTGTSLGGLYPAQLREEFRMPWLDLSRGIDELKTLALLQSLAVKLESEQSEKITDWLEAQIETLLMAMEQSRQSAMKMRTYWSVA